mgnify:CR=1 FL=1
MPNSYITLDTLKSTAGLNLGTGTAYDNRLIEIAETVSRQLDNLLNRHFYYIVETRYFDGNGSNFLFVPDLVSIGSLREDDNLDGTFDVIWNANDFILYPLNAAPTSTWGHPYSQIIVSNKSNGTQDTFLRGQRNYEIVGTWGYGKVSLDSGRNGTLADATGTGLTLSGGTVGTMFSKGQTLLIDDELLYINAAPDSTATSVNVDRAINGSTGTAHTDKDVKVLRYPGPVVDAVFIQTARLWKRKDSGFASEIGFPETGQLTILKGLDSDVKEMIRGYRRPALGLGI